MPTVKLAAALLSTPTLSVGHFDDRNRFAGTINKHFRGAIRAMGQVQVGGERVASSDEADKPGLGGGGPIAPKPSTPGTRGVTV